VSGRAGDAAELRLAPESIEALAGRLAELLGVEGQPEPEGPRQMITAAEVSARWGVARRWVYDHASELGACRLGSGSRPRLRFDPVEVAERLGAPRGGPVRADGRRLTAIGAKRHSDSLSAPTRAMFDGQGKEVTEGRTNAPRSGAEGSSFGAQSSLAAIGRVARAAARPFGRNRGGGP